jgi:hypothetical protein
MRGVTCHQERVVCIQKRDKMRETVVCAGGSVGVVVDARRSGWCGEERER